MNDLEFMLGDALVTPQKNIIKRNGEEIKLQPKVMGVLCILAQNHHRVVSLEELGETVWEARNVSNQSIQRCISAIRKSLKDANGDQELIAAFSKKGYQLLLAPQYLDQNLEATTTASSASQTNSSSSPPTPESSPKTSSYISLRHKSWLVAALLACICTVTYFLFSSQTSSERYPTILTTEYPLTHRPGREYDAIPHPDGEHFAYFRHHDNQYQILIQNSNGEHWIVDSQRGTHQRLNWTSKDYREDIWDNLAWSPNGKFLVATKLENDSSSINLYEVDFNGKALYYNVKHTLKGNLKVKSLTWWDNRNLHIAATTIYLTRDKQHQVNSRYNFSIETKTLTQIDNSSGDYIVRAKDNLLAIMNYSDEMFHLIVKRKDNTQIFKYSQTDFISDISWLPDGTGLVALVHNKLYHYYLNGKKESIRFANLDRLRRPYYQKDGKGLFITKEKVNYDIWRISPEGETYQQTYSNYEDTWGMISHDGQYLVYISERSGLPQLWLRGPDKKDQQITDYDTWQRVQAPKWSQDDTFILFKDSHSIYNYEMETGQIRKLVETSEEIAVPYPLSFIPQTNTLYFITSEDEVGYIYRLDLNTNQRHRVSDIDASLVFMIDHDAYFQKTGAAGLWLIRDGISSLVDSLIPEASRFYMHDNKGIYYWQFAEGMETDVYYLDFQTGEHSLFLDRNNFGGEIANIHPILGAFVEKNRFREEDIFILRE